MYVGASVCVCVGVCGRQNQALNFKLPVDWQIYVPWQTAPCRQRSSLARLWTTRFVR